MLDLRDTNSAEPKLAIGTSSGPISYTDALENYYKNTDWWVVFASFDLPDFQSSPLWISQKTKLPVELVIEALEGLAVLGYLRKDGGTFHSVIGKDFFEFDVKNKKKEESLYEHALISRQILNQLSEVARAAIDHRCFASNDEVLQEMYSDIANAIKKAYRSSKEAKVRDKIFKITFTATDVLNVEEQ